MNIEEPIGRHFKLKHLIYSNTAKNNSINNYNNKNKNYSYNILNTNSKNLS